MFIEMIVYTANVAYSMRRGVARIF